MPSLLLDCKTGWRNFQNQCYQSIHSYDFNLTQFLAEETCIKQNGSLVSIHTLDENEEVKSLLKSESGWLNGRRIDDGWVWSDGSQWDWEQWAPDEPKDGRDCLKMTGGQWISANCHETDQAFTCKTDIEESVEPGNFKFMK